MHHNDLVIPLVGRSGPGRPRLYASEQERLEARRKQVRQNVQAHRDRRREKHEVAPTAESTELKDRTIDRSIVDGKRPKSGPHRQRDTKQTKQRLFVTGGSQGYPLPPRRVGAGTERLGDKSFVDGYSTSTSISSTVMTSEVFCYNTLPYNENQTIDESDQVMPEEDPRLAARTRRDPTSLVSAARTDPFFTSCVSHSVSGFDSEAFDHALSYQWPVFRASSDPNDVLNIQKGIASSAMRIPAGYYSIVMAGISRRFYKSSVQNRTGTERQLLLTYKTKALQALRQDIDDRQRRLKFSRQSSSRTVDDSHTLEMLLMCVIVLSAHGTGEEILISKDRRDETRRLSRRPHNVLETAQDFDYYSTMECGMSHWQAAQYLVGEIGGIHAIKHAGLNIAVPLFDVFMAARTLYPPKFPCILPTAVIMPRLHQSIAAASMAMSARNSPSHISQPSDSSICAFDAVLKVSQNDLHRRLLNCIHNLRTITTALNLYNEIEVEHRIQREKWSPPTKQQLDLRDELLLSMLLARFSVQHEFCSLPATDAEHTTPTYIGDDIANSTPASSDGSIYELFRASIYLYTAQVTFPTSMSIEARRYLIHRILELLQLWHRESASTVAHRNRSNLTLNSMSASNEPFRRILCWSALMTATSVESPDYDGGLSPFPSDTKASQTIPSKTTDSSPPRTAQELVRSLSFYIHATCTSSPAGVTRLERWENIKAWLKPEELLWWDNLHDILARDVLSSSRE